MNKTVNQKAWFLVLPVLLLVAFSAVIPLMTVVNYSVQDAFAGDFYPLDDKLEWFKLAVVCPVGTERTLCTPGLIEGQLHSPNFPSRREGGG